MRILLHICCAPCACYPIKKLKEEGFEIFGLFYNPNIHPYQEFQKRLEAVKKLADIENLRMIYINRYELEQWLRMVVFRESRPIRCKLCYSQRFDVTAAVAKKGKFDAFTSTLFYSKFQNHEIMKMSAENAAASHGVKFMYFDFRQGWKEGIELSHKYGLYRQQYCGCIYSEKERFYRGKK